MIRFLAPFGLGSGKADECPSAERVILVAGDLRLASRSPETLVAGRSGCR
jgi:hypothetical protein